MLDSLSAWGTPDDPSGGRHECADVRARRAVDLTVRRVLHLGQVRDGDECFEEGHVRRRVLRGSDRLGERIGLPRVLLCVPSAALATPRSACTCLQAAPHAMHAQATACGDTTVFSHTCLACGSPTTDAPHLRPVPRHTCTTRTLRLVDLDETRRGTARTTAVRRACMRPHSR